MATVVEAMVAAAMALGAAAVGRRWPVKDHRAWRPPWTLLEWEGGGVLQASAW